VLSAERYIKPLWLAGLAAACLTTALSCDEGKPERSPPKTLESSLRDYLETLPPESSGNDIAGPVLKITCKRLRETYKGTRVSACDVTHRSGTITTWCAVQIEGKLYTDLDHGVPCLRH
jgi:hypothetical protein